MTSDITSALEVSHIMRYTNWRILYFTLDSSVLLRLSPHSTACLSRVALEGNVQQVSDGAAGNNLVICLDKGQ